MSYVNAHQTKSHRNHQTNVTPQSKAEARASRQGWTKALGFTRRPFGIAKTTSPVYAFSREAGSSMADQVCEGRPRTSRADSHRHDEGWRIPGGTRADKYGHIVSRNPP